MSSGITFLDYKEAREYQEMLLKEGMNSSLSKQHGGYVVVPKEKTNIKMKTVPQEILGEHTAGEHWGYPEGHIIAFRPRASTRIKLHEVGHAKADHRTVGGIKTGDIIERELDAESYAFRQQGREVNYRVGADAVRQLAAESKDLNQLNSIINEVSRRMERRGIKVTRENKQDLFDLTLAEVDDPEVEKWKTGLREQL